MEGGAHVPAGYNGVDGTHGAHGPHGDIEGGHGELINQPRLQTEKAVVDTTQSGGGKGMAEVESVDEKYTDASEEKPAAAQILGVAILEFGVVFHSVRPEPSSTLDGVYDC